MISKLIRMMKLAQVDIHCYIDVKLDRSNNDTCKVL